MKAFVWGIAVLFTIAAYELAPTAGKLWLVQYPDSYSLESTILSLQSNNIRIASINANNRIVIEPDENVSVGTIYKSGATFVVAANAALGCSAAQSSPWKHNQKGSAK